MPELPEVETCRRGLIKYLENEVVSKIVIRQTQLRYPVPQNLSKILLQQKLNQITRRGKYLLFHFSSGVLLFHLGMSGSLRVLQKDTTLKKHDHIDIYFSKNLCMRYHDPRRFGMLLWLEHHPFEHPLLKNLGPEPLTSTFNAEYFYTRSRQRKLPIKNFLMNNQIVVGVGNIYANEALFIAGISPMREASQLSFDECQLLTKTVKRVLRAAIRQGGTTLRDFLRTDGKPGYFKQELHVYGKAHKPCPKCSCLIQEVHLGQRNSFYCPACQN